MLLVDARRERLTIDSKREFNNNNNNESVWSRFNRLAAPHNKLSKRALSAHRQGCDRSVRIALSINKKSECRVSILDRSPLHNLNKRHSEIADKIEGNTAAVRHDCISV